MNEITIGVDISKASLDVHFLPDGRAMRLTNDRKGFTAFRKAIRGGNVRMVVFEPTGAYHRHFEAMLSANGLIFAKVNPRMAKRFGEALGTRAKTDMADAELLARYGAVLVPEPTRALPEKFLTLKELHTARLALVKDRTAVLARRNELSVALLKSQAARRLAQVEKDLEAVEREMMLIIRSDPALSRRLDLLMSIKGVGETTAAMLVVEMPELGMIDGKAVAALAGVAPMTRESGKWKGRSFIRAGRAIVRRGIYMAALVAARFNPGLSRKYKSLVAAGKPAKVALTAIARKLLILANTIIRENREWRPQTP